MKTRELYILPGDGIGPEVCAQVEAIVAWLNAKDILQLSVENGLVGGASYDVFGSPLTEETLMRCKSADAILLGAVGGEKWRAFPRAKRPEAGLLALRKRLDLFANLRPAVTFSALLDASSIKPEVIKDLNVLIVRELASGVYFGEPRGMQTLESGLERCVDTQSYTQKEIERVADVAFQMAKQRGGKVHSVEKSNVMETGIFWRNIVQRRRDTRFDDVHLEHMYADTCAMELVRNPKQFDVILTDNLFGDILSDVMSVCTGSIGMLPSASLGEVNPQTNRRLALYEPVHGSAPEIAGKDLANPCAAILSFAMMLRYSFSCGKIANSIENAIKTVLDQGVRTADILSPGCQQVGCNEMGERIIRSLEERLF